MMRGVSRRAARCVGALIVVGFVGVAAATAAAALDATAVAHAADESSAAVANTVSNVVIYRGATLIDVVRGITAPDTSVVVEGAVISRVGLAREIDSAIPAGAEVVDMSGHFVLPGLVDSHEHLATPPDRNFAEAMMRRDLYSGITAVRDMADDLRAVGDLARASLVGEIPGPDIYYAALMAGPSFFADPRTGLAAQGATPGAVPWMQAITEQTDMPLAVAMARGTYATGIKIYANLPGALVGKITNEAHKQGIAVWAHGMVFPATPKEVVDAGVDVVSHVCYLAYQASHKRPQSYQQRFPVDYSKFDHGDNPNMTALFSEMHRRGTILDATNAVYVEAEKRAAKHPGGTPPFCTSDLTLRLTHQAFRQGVLISTGTDGFTSASDPFPLLYEEIALLAKAGVPAPDVIKSATLVGAMTLGHQSEMGTVEPGKLANLMFVEKNPLENVDNLRTVVLTVKRGVPYPRGEFRPVRPEEVPAEYRE